MTKEQLQKIWVEMSAQPDPPPIFCEHGEVFMLWRERREVTVLPDGPGVSWPKLPVMTFTGHWACANGQTGEINLWYVGQN